MEKIVKPRGTADVFPPETAIFQSTERKAAAVAENFGAGEIRFPTFEHTELFTRGIGGSTDVVRKEMYTFEDKGGRSMTLRPEGTASVVRACIENGLFGGALPLKLYYIAPNFRYEKPGAGRLREHHQFGVEYFGAAGFAADAEVVALADSFLRGVLGRGKTELYLNSLGCPECRVKYREALVSFLNPRAGRLCGDCKERLERNPLRVLDCKIPSCGEIIKDAPRLSDFLCGDCVTHRDGLYKLLTYYGITYREDGKLVRGLDYYTKTVFEFKNAEGLTVLGGGRYDGLVAELGGGDVPALGFGCGLERLASLTETAPDAMKPRLCVIYTGDAPEVAARTLANALRNAGVRTECDITGRALKAQFNRANKLGADYALTIGERELETGSGKLKNLRTGEETEITLDSEVIKNALQ